MSFYSAIDDNKTKILGAVCTGLAFVQANPEALGVILSPKAYALTMFVVGVGVTVCGFLNSQVKQ